MCETHIAKAEFTKEISPRNRSSTFASWTRWGLWILLCGQDQWRIFWGKAAILISQEENIWGWLYLLTLGSETWDFNKTPWRTYYVFLCSFVTWYPWSHYFLEKSRRWEAHGVLSALVMDPGETLRIRIQLHSKDLFWAKDRGVFPITQECAMRNRSKAETENVQIWLLRNAEEQQQSKAMLLTEAESKYNPLQETYVHQHRGQNPSCETFHGNRWQKITYIFFSMSKEHESGLLCYQFKEELQFSSFLTAHLEKTASQPLDLVWWW